MPFTVAVATQRAIFSDTIYNVTLTWKFRDEVYEGRIEMSGDMGELLVKELERGAFHITMGVEGKLLNCKTISNQIFVLERKVYDAIN